MNLTNIITKDLRGLSSDGQHYDVLMGPWDSFEEFNTVFTAVFSGNVRPGTHIRVYDWVDGVKQNTITEYAWNADTGAWEEFGHDFAPDIANINNKFARGRVIFFGGIMESGNQKVQSAASVAAKDVYYYNTPGCFGVKYSDTHFYNNWSDKLDWMDGSGKPYENVIYVSVNDGTAYLYDSTNDEFVTIQEDFMANNLATINGQALLNGGENIDIKRPELSFRFDDTDGCLYMQEAYLDDGTNFAVDTDGYLTVTL